MKKHNWMVFGVVLVLGLFVFAAGALALTPEEKEAIVADVKEEIKDEGAGWAQHFMIGGLIEFGGVWQDVNMRRGKNEDKSDFCLTTVELAVEAEVTEWINVEAILLYEDPTFGEETSLDVDEATITIGNTEKSGFYVTGGKMYVPFGAILTSFPDDPLVHAPLTQLMGETNEKALLLGWELGGFTLSAYCYNGDMDKEGKNNKIDSYGFDANFAMELLDLLVGASYISNIADSDGLSEKVSDLWGLKDYVGGYDVYGHIELGIFFIDAEYMAALDKFEVFDEDDYEEAKKASVWNVEAGFGDKTQIVAKYAGSDKAADLGYPKTRYGLCLNQQIHEGVVASVAYLYDDYYTDDADDRKDSNLFCAQMAVEF
ncbi:MAG: LbtU family siderophore porin [Desulfobacterales bacterium]|nr:LbtU family siderophore porin [Desulfobacterales bacterium]